MSCKIDFNNLTVGYGSKVVLQNFSFHCREGFVFILGANGVGKTTLLKTLLGQIKPIKGQIFIDDKNLITYSWRQLAGLLAFVPQSSTFTYGLSVLEMATLGCYHRLNFFAKPSDHDRDEALKWLDYLGIKKLAHRAITQLSGGQAQLVLIARALVQNPSCFIFDEMTGHLDFGFTHHVMEIAKELSKQRLVIVTTHDPILSLTYGDQLVMLKDQSLVYQGDPCCDQSYQCLEELYGRKLKVVSLKGFPPFLIPLERERIEG